MQLGKSNFFQFALHFLHTDTLGQRRINVQCFFGNSGPFFGLLQKMQRPHVMQAVSQFNQQHANVFRHCQQQLAKILRLFVVGRFLLNHCQLGQTVHQLRHLIAEQRADFFNRRIGVFHRIVQQPGDNRRGIKLKLGQNTGNFHRMRIIGVAGSPQLSPVFFIAKTYALLRASSSASGSYDFTKSTNSYCLSIFSVPYCSFLSCIFI